MTTTDSARAAYATDGPAEAVPDPAGLTARQVLFGPTDDRDTDPLEDALLEQRIFRAVQIAVAGARDGVMQEVRAEVLRRAEEMLTTPVLDRLVEAWRSYEELLEAGRATVDEPGTTRVVDLACTRTTSTHTWSVQVIVGAPRISIDFTLSMVFTLHAAAATVIGGRITRLGDGRCELHATFTALGRELADHQEQIDLYDHLTLDPGILLVEPAADAAYAAGPARGADAAGPARAAGAD